MANGKRISTRNLKTWAWAYALIAPTVLLILSLNIWPILQTLWYSFNKVKGMASPQWIGLDNYTHALKDKELLRSIINTGVYTLGTVPIGVAISLLTAVFLNTAIKGKSFFRTLYFLPVVSAPVAVALVWRWLFNSDYGLINYVLSLIGINGPNWIGSPKFIMPSAIIVGIWSMIGYNMIILLAGLQGIPKTFYEAAEIDGAGPIAKFKNITLPLITPTLFFVTITTVISSLQVFDSIFMLLGQNGTQSPSQKAAESIVYMFYNYTFKNSNIGYGSTIATILLIIILMITGVQMKLQKKWVHYQ